MTRIPTKVYEPYPILLESLLRFMNHKPCNSHNGVCRHMAGGRLRHRGAMWGFPKIGGTLFGRPFKELLCYLGCKKGTPILGKHPGKVS